VEPYPVGSQCSDRKEVHLHPLDLEMEGEYRCRMMVVLGGIFGLNREEGIGGLHLYLLVPECEDGRGWKRDLVEKVSVVGRGMMMKRLTGEGRGIGSVALGP
jgi:hypothetical protein